MGRGYAGVDETLKRRVALTAIRARTASTSRQARFSVEAQISRSSTTPHCACTTIVEAATATGWCWS